MSNPNPSTGSVSSENLKNSVDTKATSLQDKIDAMANNTDMNPGEMLQLQWEMNLFAQFLETSTQFTGVIHEGQSKIIRNLK
jgi:hypothetical protein